MLSQFPARFGKYILLDRLAAGGMAEVFRAKIIGAENFERLVAIKCMLPQLLEDEQFTSMFIDEAKLASQLAHANIIQIYELGREGERLYIAMELVHGRDVRHIIRTAKAETAPLEPKFAAYVISRAALGLDFAHRRIDVQGQPLNLVHRDISPQNILVSYDGEVKVVDFGIAKAEMRRTETQTGMLKGKFAYMSPEQVLGHTFDCRADIFALGSVLFELLTGERLFSGENELTVLERVREADIPDLQAILSPQCAALRHVLLRALAKDPDNRYAHASEMSEDLEGFLIEDRAIFAAKRAAQVMTQLYGAEIKFNSNKLREYAALNVSDLDAGDEALASAQAFFRNGPTTASPKETTQTRSRQAPTSQKTAGQAPDETGPSTPTPVVTAPSAPAIEPDPPSSDGPRDWRSLSSMPRPAPNLPQRPARAAAFVSSDEEAQADIAPGAGPAEGGTSAATKRSPPARTFLRGRGAEVSAPRPAEGTQARDDADEGDGPSSRPEHTQKRRGPRSSRRTSAVLWRMRAAMLATLTMTLTLVMVAALKVQRTTHKPLPILGSPPWLPAMFSRFLPDLPDRERGQDEAGDDESFNQQQKYGWLAVRSVSGGTPAVRIDGKLIGNLPLAPQRLTVGAHEVVLEQDEGGQGRVRRAPVTVSPNHTERAPRLLTF